MPEPHAQRTPVLDGVRGLAILLVLLFHGTKLAPHGVLGVDAVKRVCGIGWAGVDLFFVLSGFLITGILLRAEKAPRGLRHFYVRRVLRIFPIYYFAMGLLFLVLPRLVNPNDEPGLPFVLEHQGWFWAYLQNWLFSAYGKFPTFMPVHHLWSLAIEEQFYLAWPMLVLFAPRRVVKGLALAIVCGAPLFRGWLLHEGYSWSVLYVNTLTRFDSLGFGCLLALLSAEGVSPTLVKVGRSLFLPLLVVTGLLLYGAPVSHSDPLVQTAGYSLLGLLFATLIMLVLDRPDSPGAKWLSAPWFRFFGKYSYAIYVFHWPIYCWLGDRFFADGTYEKSPVLLCLGSLIAGGAASTALALVTWNLFEKRFIALKERFS